MATIEIFEKIRFFILITGWPILIIGSIYLTAVTFKFYRDVEKSVFGKLVIAMVVGWFVSMYSLGITATAYMITDAGYGVPVVIPVFLVWFITMVVITWTVLRWSREAATLSAFYHGLENLVKERTAELKKAYSKQIAREKEIRKLRERFVFIAAHELRTPVTAIDWGLKTLLEDREFRETVSQDYIRLLENLQTKNKTLLDLVADTLNVARLQAGTIAIEPEGVSLQAIVNDVKGIIEKLVHDNSIRVSWPIDKRALPPVLGHTIALREIFTNLLTNAVRYNRAGGEVVIDAEVGDKEIIVQVRDTGIGMTEQEIKGLFNEFYRIKNQETKNIDGTGLGLFVSKQLIEKIGGKMWVESAKGKGSTFFFSLTRADKKSGGVKKYGQKNNTDT